MMDGGQYSPRVKKPRQFPQACWALERKYQHVPNSRLARILIPRMMIGPRPGRPRPCPASQHCHPQPLALAWKDLLRELDRFIDHGLAPA
jgi:hypothetical protein